MNGILHREEELFDAALELRSPSERAAFLERECAGESALRARIEKLLAAHERAENFFVECNPALDAVDRAAHPLSDKAAEANPELHKTIGPYKLLQKIGEGGCGVVYMAEQQKPVRRRVALKIIKLGMDTKSVIARFEAERQALAMMEHPNIARALDAGATETGRPYFVMELVNGIKITNYCDERQLDTRQRLDLFIQVCQAIQHAHQKGVIHRDIKPSNILVTHHDGRPVPKVIDFGIAKATQEPLTDKTLFTMYGHFIGTPAYMSPEQAEMSGLDVDTRGDIYSLGVLLYELLTGKTPFDQSELMESGLDEMRRTLREREPHRPSTKLDTLPTSELTATALHRHAEPPKLRSLLSGDLDWIVMKALEKDRTRRYETANGLAMDIERYLNDEPVVARPPSRTYRLQKLVRRNRGVFAAIGVVTLALVIGVGALTISFLVERKARQRAVAAERAAELARVNEAELRRQSELREKVTTAALFVREGRFEEADKLAAGIIFDKPSLDGAEVLRSLGESYALEGRWPQAADHFEQLLKVNELDGLESASQDVLSYATALAEVGDSNRFENFRRSISGRFAAASNPAAAERALKASLLTPMNEAALEAVEPLARTLIPATPVAVGNPHPALRQQKSGSTASFAGDDFATNLKLSEIGTRQYYTFRRTNGTIVMISGGANIWETNDACVFAHALIAGDFDLRMRVHSVAPELDNFTRVGLMAREGVDQGGSRHVMVAVNAENSFQVLRRLQEGKGTASAPQNPLPPAYGSNSWVRLQRVGAIFHGYTSSNGVDWVQLYQTTGGDTPFADPIYVGVAATAHDPNALSTNVLSDLGETPTVPANMTVTLALDAYRRGNFEQAADWCRRSLAYPEYDAVRVATARTILAMASARLGKLEDARGELNQAHTLIEGKFPSGLTAGSESRAFWLDWAYAEILLREAQLQIN